MACPSSSKLCQFCDESSIKWKCSNCKLHLCQLCNRKIHSKIEPSKGHYVTNLEDCGSDDGVETNHKTYLNKLPCTAHSDQKCVLYCKNCDRPVCSDCLIEGHQEHIYCKLDHIYDKKLKIIQDMKDRIESDIPHFKEKEENLQKLLSEGTIQYTENKDKIAEFKDNIVKYADGLLSDLDKQWKPMEDLITKEIHSVRQRKDELEKRKIQLDQTMRSPFAGGILVTSFTLDKPMPDKTVRHMELKERKFVPGKLQTSVLLGMVYNVPDFQLLQTYQNVNCTISKFIKCDDNSAFIGSDLSMVLQKVSLKTDRIKSEREVRLYVYDMAMMDNGDLLISLKQQNLKLYTKDGKIKTFKSFAPLCTLGVHVNNQNEIFVGFSESRVVSIPKVGSVRRVVQINQKGIILHTYEHDIDNQRLFTWPARICTKNNFICVVDYSDHIWHGKGRVVVIDKGGQLQWTYNGKLDEFYPEDIAVTSTDMVIVTDRYNYVLHVLSPTGEVIVCKEVRDLGIQYPFSLSIDKNDKLWIGTRQPKKIHAIKLI
ncbi:TRIM45 [Mytilus coruscus]|uniref:TRIM45 n=1 Tax=Mytilus coruscus TaxID=42192 RepID=A0A6J8AMI4_MYTCO|nr:TRIM45 [Mytilus coruscus]